MADKTFGTKNLKLISSDGYAFIDCDSTIEINSPNYVNINADTVGVSTDLTIGGQVSSDLIVGNGFYVGIGTTIPRSSLDVRGDVNIAGIVTAATATGIITYYGDTSHTVSGRWTLTGNGSNYTFTGIGITSGNNTNPVLYLARGRVYEFVNTQSSSHPFAIRLSNGGNSYSSGVSTYSTDSSVGFTTVVTKFEIPFNAPNTLYYQCTVHSGMGNTISVYPSTI